MRTFDGDTIAPALAAILDEAIRRRERIEALEAALREIQKMAKDQPWSVGCYGEIFAIALIALGEE